MKIILHSWYIEIWSDKFFHHFIRLYLIVSILISCSWIFSSRSRSQIKKCILESYNDHARQHSKCCGFALWPLLLINTSALHKEGVDESYIPFIVNHEKIHLRQQIELPFGLFYVFTFLEYLYIQFTLYGKSMYVLKSDEKNPAEAYSLYIKNQKAYLEYVLMSSEQEAYLNMFDLNYLKKRKLFSQLKFFFKKKPVHQEKHQSLAI
jgi:hypothetical protein